MVFAPLSVVKHQELQEKLSPPVDNKYYFQIQEEETPSLPTVEHVPDPSLTKHASKLDGIAEKNFITVFVGLGLVLLLIKLQRSFVRDTLVNRIVLIRKDCL
jgi:hypothetical protein